MKCFLFLSLLFFCFSNNFSQRETPEGFPQPTEKKTASFPYKPSLITAHQSHRYNFAYDDHGNLRWQITESWTTGTWENLSRDTYTYDGSDHCLTYTGEDWINNAWTNFHKNIYSYDQKGNRVEAVYQDWSDAAWVNNFRYLYNFDVNNNLLSETFFLWTNSAWENSLRKTYTSDDSGNCLSITDELYLNNSWVNTTKEMMTYDNHNRQLTRMTQEWINNNWVNKGLWSYTYDNSGYRVSYTYQGWSNNSWQNSLKVLSTYNSTYTYTETITQSWYYGTTWVNTIKSTDTLNDPVNYTIWNHNTYRWMNDQWVNEEQSKRTYDLPGNELTYLNEKWYGTAWQNDKKKLASYNAYNNLIHCEWFEWSFGNWVPYIGSVNIVFESGGDLHVIWMDAKVVDAQYTNIAGIAEDYTGINSFDLQQNYPNPFNPTTKINYSIAKEGQVKLTVYDALGRKVATLVDEYKPAGSYHVQFNGSNLSSTVYMYRLESGNKALTKKFILMK